MRNVMLWGDGPHLDLYYQAFCFLDEVEQIGKNGPLSGRETDLVITEPFYLTPERLHTIVGSEFRSTIIVEKPAVRSPSALIKLLEALSGCAVYIAHTRLFAPPLPLPDAGGIIIDWPNRYDTHMDPLHNTLPNIVDALYVCCGGNMPALADAKQADGTLCFLFQAGGREITVRVIVGKEGQKVSVNGVDHQWPNAFDTMTAVWHAAHGANPEASHAHALASLNMVSAAAQLLAVERK